MVGQRSGRHEDGRLLAKLSRDPALELANRTAKRVGVSFDAALRLNLAKRWIAISGLFGSPSPLNTTAPGSCEAASRMPLMRSFMKPPSNSLATID